MTKKNFNFEESYHRLEEILELMNSNTISLEKSIALYEEADTLMKQCSNYLNNAEQKIHVLMKNRDKEIVMDESGQPQLKAFSPTSEQLIVRNIEN
ncbi:MAG: exodeoxyribonuclease VII small subunit [Chlamydiales bacterium]|nr:exodeoxyribonuclease VII small subunit [Chlamydiales bacterium]